MKTIVKPQFRQVLLYLLVFNALILATLLNAPIGGFVFAAPAQQDATQTPTFTLSPTASQEVTAEVSPTATEVGTASPTTDLTASITPSPTVGVTATQSPLPSSTPTSGIISSMTPTFTLQPTTTQTVILTPADMTTTATYIPLPTLTMIYPKVTPTAYLMASYRSPDSVPKQRFPLLIRVLARFWPLSLMFLIWGGLIAWFVVVQIKGEKEL